MSKATFTSTTKPCQCLECQIVSLILTQQRVAEKGTFNSAEVLKGLAGALGFLTVEIQKAVPLSDPLGEVYGLAMNNVTRRVDRAGESPQVDTGATVH